jgi:twitching motility protein PilT
MNQRLQDILKLSMELGASDIHLKGDHPPVFRVGDLLKWSSLPVLMNEEMQEMLKSMATPNEIAKFNRDKDIDFSLSAPGLSRFRVNCFRQSDSISFVLRQIPMTVPTVEEIVLPQRVLEAAEHESGLFLLCGTTGSGKSTTIAAILDWLNKNRQARIITLEDPIEFLFKDQKCDFLQREFRRDFTSFPEALGAALRQDPDIILVGEMREAETIELALMAAETGHLVFSTLHASTAASAVDRICGVFPADLRSFIQEQLASVLVCIIAQTLLPTVDVKSFNRRIAAREILYCTPAIANIIRSGKQEHIASFLETGREEGMISMNVALERLVTSGRVKVEEALAKSPDPEALQGRLSRK